MEFEWKIFPGLTTIGILNQIQQMMGKLQCESETFTGRIIFMSMFNDIVWDAKGKDELCVNNSKTIKEHAERFPRGHWSFLGPGSEKKWYETYGGKLDGSWNRTAEKMLLNFAETNHPVLRCTSPLERTIKKQRRRRDNNSLQRKHGKYRVAPPDGHLRQSVQSLRSSSGYDCRITSWSESSGETHCIRSAGKTRNSYTTSSSRIASQ